MCEPISNLRFIHVDTRNVDRAEVQPIIQAAFDAQDTTCCAKRQAAISVAVFDKAQELGYDVAWGDVLKRDDEDGVHFYLWRKDTHHIHTIEDMLARERGHKITRQALEGARV